MRILIDITHPAYAHFFLPIIPALHEQGHDIIVTSRQKDVTTDLLDMHHIKHTCLTRTGRSRLGLFFEMIVRDWRLLSVIRSIHPDVVLARDGAFACQAAWLAGVPSISFDDTDDAHLQHKLYFRLASRIYTDESYRVHIGAKQRFYRGVSPVAYLHPDVFRPDPSILEQVNLNREDPFILIRLVSWTANHDYGEHGFDRKHLLALIEELEVHGRVLITSETPLSNELESRRIQIPVHQMHDLMAFATLYIGESATMAAESAVLGVPAVYVSTRSTWYTHILEDPHGLLRHVVNAEQCLEAAKDILGTEGFQTLYRTRGKAYLAETDNLCRVALDALAEFDPLKTVAPTGSKK